MIPAAQLPPTASQIAAQNKASVATNSRASEEISIPKPGITREPCRKRVSGPIPGPSPIAPSHVPPIVREPSGADSASQEPTDATTTRPLQSSPNEDRPSPVLVPRPPPAPPQVSRANADQGEQRAAKRRRIGKANEDAASEAAESAAAIPGEGTRLSTQADETSQNNIAGPMAPSQIFSQPIRQSIEPAQPTKTKEPRISKQARAKKRAIENAAADIVADAVGERARKPKKRRKAQPEVPAQTTGAQQTAEERAAEVVQGAVKKKKPRKKHKKRASTPEGAEDYQIIPSQVTMSELTGNVRTGRRSSRDKELQVMQEAEKDKKKLARKNAREGNTDEQPSGTEAAAETAEERLERLARERRRSPSYDRAVPNTIIVNGQIQLDESSLVIDRHARAARDRDAEAEDFIEENELTRRVNSLSWLKIDKSGGWNEVLTEQFYDGLRMFGTDFNMISKMFPGRSRHSVKLKFNKEEKLNAWRIESTLKGEKLAVDIDEFSKLSNTTFGDPRELDREMAEDKKKIEAEEAQAKAAMEEAEKERADQAAREAAANREEDSAEESEACGEEPDYVSMKEKRQTRLKNARVQKRKHASKNRVGGATSGGVTS